MCFQCILEFKLVAGSLLFYRKLAARGMSRRGKNCKLLQTLRFNTLGLFLFVCFSEFGGEGAGRSIPEAESYFPRKFSAPTFPSLGKVSETTSPSHWRNFSIHPTPEPQLLFFFKYPKDVGRKEVSKWVDWNLHATDACPLLQSQTGERYHLNSLCSVLGASKPNYWETLRLTPRPF